MSKGNLFLFGRVRELLGKRVIGLESYQVRELSVCVFSVRCAISVIMCYVFCPTADSMLSFSVLNKYSKKIHFLVFLLLDKNRWKSAPTEGRFAPTERRLIKR